MNFAEAWCETCSLVGYAARVGDLELMNRLIKEHKPVDVSDNRGWRPLHEAAAAAPNIECLQRLLKHGESNINWQTHEGETALLLACKRRHGINAATFVNLLLQHHADPNIVDNEEDGPLLESVRSQNKPVVELLINAGANVNAPDCSRWTPLHEAATRQNHELVDLLLKNNALIDAQDECGMTALFTAAQHGCERCLNLLLVSAQERNQGHVVNIGAEDFATPLMIAAQQGFFNCVQLLLNYGADPNLKTSDNATALHLAVQGNNNSCLKILLEKMNLEPLIQAFHPSSYEEREIICPLHLAVEWGSYGALKLLLNAGFSPDSLYSCSDNSLSRFITYLPDNETALSYAAFKRDRISMAILISGGASVNPPLKNAFHPLLRAMTNPASDAFNVLLESGSDINYQRQPEPSNEVFLYSLLASTSYMKQLLYYGCDPNSSFQSDSEIFFFIRCAGYLIRKERMPLYDLFKLLMRFLVVSKGVQCAFHELNSMFPHPGEVNEMLDILSFPSSLKQLSALKIRRHIYSIHGIKLPDMVCFLSLPPILEEQLACHDLKQ